MKAVTQGISRCNDPLNVKNEVFKIHRPKMDEGEMSACFSKLKELVPSIPHNKKISKTQLLQHVIDYIYDLELSLDYQPVQSLFNSTVREPLSEKTEPNQMVIDENEADCELDYERPASK